MCGRIRQPREARVWADQYRAQLLFDLLPPTYPDNLSPGQVIGVVRLDDKGQREAAGCLWGLIPSWSKTGKADRETFNARCETLAEKPSYRAAYRTRRCIIPAIGFYEPKGPKGTKRTPYHVHRGDGGLMALAGLWERWRDAAGNFLDSCTVITTTPNEVLASIHLRMPVILSDNDVGRWLDPNTPGDDVAGLMRPAAPEGMVAFEVARMGSLDLPQRDVGLFG